MILSQRSSAWLLATLQTILAIFFAYYLSNLLGINSSQLFQGPTWLVTLILLHFGLAALLALCALWKFELTGILLLFAIHTVCPLLFFTDLTRNPYFTQIVLLNIWIAFLWIVWAWECLKNKKILFPKTALDLPLCSFFLIAIVSWLLSFISHEASFYAAMRSEGTKSLLFLLINAIGVFYIAVTLDEQWRRRFIWTTFLVGGVAAMYGLMQFYGMESIWQKSLTPFANRPVSTFGNPNFLSSYLLLLIPLLFVNLMLTKESYATLFSFFLLIVLVTGVIATMTRSTWVGTLLALAFLPLARSVRDFMKKHNRKLVAILLVLVLSVLFWPKSKLGGYSNPWERVIEIKSVKDPGGYGPWHQRILIWSCCWNMLRDHLLFGKGWGLLELFYPYYQGKALFNPIFRTFRTHANNAHNEMLEVWSQTGFLGMGIYAWLWVVLIWVGIKSARQFYPSDPEKSIWSWAFTVSAIGMFVDNFFGNVSIHFAVPAFLFWWQVGLLFSLLRSEKQFSKPSAAEWRMLPIQNNFQKSALSAAAIFTVGTCIFNFRREFQEIYYFRGFKISKSSGALDPARIELENAWQWYPREVNSNYELANAYARLSHQSAQMGLNVQSETWRKKAIWGYLESLRSNCGYDEIYFNLAAIQSQMGWTEDNAPDLTIDSPRGIAMTESAKKSGGSVYNFSRALAINPLSDEIYNFLGNVFLQNRAAYGEEAKMLFRQGIFFFPQKKDFWINLAFLEIQSKNFEQAYGLLKKAMMLDPFYDLTRRNLLALLTQMKQTNDPLGEAAVMIGQLNGLIQSKNWPQLRQLGERIVTILPENFQLRFILANVYFELHEWQKAEKEYLEALKLDSGNLTALNNLALTYRSQNKLMEARNIYQKIVGLNPGDIQAQNQLRLSSQ